MEPAKLCRASDLLMPCSSHKVVAVLPSNQPTRGGQQMNSPLSSARSWFSATLWQSRNDWFLIKGLLLDRPILPAIGFLLTFCVGAAAALAWQSSRGTPASIPQTAPKAVAPSSNQEQQLQAISLDLAAVRQSVAELSGDLGQMRRDITNLQTTQQALVDKISEPPPRPAAAQPPKPTPRSSQAPTSAR